MNKRIYFILFPLLAILFSISRPGTSLFIRNAATYSSIAKSSDQNHFPASPDVNKNNQDRIKNAIRIKAKHNAFAINITALPDPVFPNLPFHKVIYGGYRENESHAHFSSSGLRGPPAA